MKFILYICIAALVFAPSAFASPKCAVIFAPAVEITHSFTGRTKRLSDLQVLELANEPVKTAIEIGAYDRPVCEGCIYIDLFTQGLEPLKDSPEPKLVANATDLPFRDHSVDRVVTMNFPILAWAGSALKHIDDVMRELSRVLNDDGVAFVMTSPWPKYSIYPFWFENPTDGQPMVLMSNQIMPSEWIFERAYQHYARAAEKNGLKFEPFRSPHFEGLMLRRR